MFNSGKAIDSIPDLRSDKLWLRAHAVTTTDKASFYYSTDNKIFKKFGNDLNMRYRLTIFTGNKFCIFNYATRELGGYVDVNWFQMETRQGPPNLFKAQDMIDAEFYDDIFMANPGICSDIANLKDQEVTEIENGSWIKFDQIDFGKDVRNFFARVSSENNGGTIEVHIDGVDGPVIGKCNVGKTENRQTFVTVSCPVSTVASMHPVVLKFVGGEGKLMNINWFSFSENPLTIKTIPEIMAR